MTFIPELQVVAAAVIHNGKVLCMQRGASRYPYTACHWEFPGGKVEQGETPRQALRRELIEEMEYPVKIHELIGEVHHRYPDFSIHLMLFHCTATTTRFRRKEHIDHRWLFPSEMSSLDWCAADYPLIKTLEEDIWKNAEERSTGNEGE